MDFYRAIDRFGPVRGPVRDRSSDRSPLIPSYNEEEDRGNECSKNQKYDQLEEEIRRQVDFYRAIDRSGPVRGPVRDRSSHSSERSPLFPSHNEGESLENECGGNQKYHQLEEEIQRQVDSYRAIDRSGPVRGPVRDRSSDRSPLFPSYSEGECRENDYIVDQKYNQLEDEIQRQVDFHRAIDRFGPVRGPVWDRSSDRSPLNLNFNAREYQENDCRANHEYNQLKDEIQRQVDFHRAIDRFGPVRGPVWDRSSDRSPLNLNFNAREYQENDCRANHEYNHSNGEFLRQVDSYRAIDRFGPVRGPVCDRSNDRPPFYLTSNEGDHCENLYKQSTLYLNERARRGEDEQVEESHDRSIWNRSDDRAINRSHDRANDRSLKKSILYSNERSRRGEDEQVEESHDRSIWNRSDDRAINRSHDRANDRSLKKSILYLNERARRGEDEQVEESHDRSIWNRSDDRAINRSHDRANDRSLKKSILYSNESARRGEDEQVEESHDRSIWNRSDDRANDRSLKKSILYSNERARRGEDEQVEESHDRSIWNRSDDRAINRSHDRANDRSLKKSILYSNERARRGEDEQVEESHDRSIWNRSDDRAINRSHDRANDRSLKKSILYSNERARRGEDEQVEESHDRSIWNRSDDRAINRSHDRANDRSLKKSILYSTKGPEEAKMNKWKKVMTGQSGTGPMTGQSTGPMTGQMTGPSKSRYYT